jgi:hypothetical protein
LQPILSHVGDIAGAKLAAAPRGPVRRGLVALVAALALASLSMPAVAAASHTRSTRARGWPIGTFRVGLRVIRFVDGRRHRTLLTYVRYPAVGEPSRREVPSGVPDRSRGRYPLIVFGHGFDVTPSTYSSLLHAWASAGFVVAAPVFPHEAAGSPGGATRSDLFNEPADMSFVITELLRLNGNRHGRLSRIVASTEIGVAGHSDGAIAALALAYDTRYRDGRVRAAAILSGAAWGGFSWYRGGKAALLASQGTSDTINNPSNTYAYFDAAPRPKYLLKLLGAEHLPPYTTEQPQLRTVERVSSAFFDGYLKGVRVARRRIGKVGTVRGVSTVTHD